MSQFPNDSALSNHRNLSLCGLIKEGDASSSPVLAASWGWQDVFAEEASEKFGPECMPHGRVDDLKDGVCESWWPVHYGLAPYVAKVIEVEVNDDRALIQQRAGIGVDWGPQLNSGRIHRQVWQEVQA